MVEKQDTEKTDAVQGNQSKKTPTKHKVLWLTAMLACVAALVVGVQLTLSAFTGSDFLKAVAVTGTSQDLFASDMLAPYSSASEAETPVLRSIVVNTSGDKKCSFTFRIYNCLLDDQKVFNDKEVKYALSVKATGVEGGTWSISSNLAQDVKNPHAFPVTRGEVVVYTITLDDSLVDKASFKIVALVDKDKSPGTSKYCLAARVAPVNRSDAASASVSGAWVDTNKDKNNVGDYAAYNYRITVTGEEKTVRVTWGSKVELDSHFGTNHPKASVDRTKRTATLTVKPGSETINFYRTGSTEPSSWDDLGVKVEEVKTQSTAN